MRQACKMTYGTERPRDKKWLTRQVSSMMQFKSSSLNLSNLNKSKGMVRRIVSFIKPNDVWLD
jgi:hypothetical protein